MKNFESDYEPYECGEMTALRNEAQLESRKEAAMYEFLANEARKAYGYLCETAAPFCTCGKLFEGCDALPF